MTPRGPPCVPSRCGLPDGCRRSRRVRSSSPGRPSQPPRRGPASAWRRAQPRACGSPWTGASFTLRGRPSGLLRQRMAVERRRPGDRRAQQRHFPRRAVITALDRASHAGAMSSRLRSSLIDHGSHHDKSPGGLQLFSAHAASHASSQLRMSMPFIESVPTTEYMIAVNLAPSSLSEPNDSRRPMAGPRKNLSARLLSRGTCGRSTKTLSPSRWFSSERSALPSRAGSGRPASVRHQNKWDC